MKTTVFLIGTAVGFFILGLILNYLGESNTGQEIRDGITIILNILGIGLPIVAFCVMIWAVLFGPYDGPPYF